MQDNPIDVINGKNTVVTYETVRMIELTWHSKDEKVYINPKFIANFFKENNTNKTKIMLATSEVFYCKESVDELLQLVRSNTFNNVAELQ